MSANKPIKQTAEVLTCKRNNSFNIVHITYIYIEEKSK